MGERERMFLAERSNSFLQFVTYMSLIFGYCHVTFPYTELLSLFRGFLYKVIVSGFSD